MKPLRRFAKLEAAGGILLIACTVTALIWANSPWAASYNQIWHAKLSFGFQNRKLSEDLHFWINDALMALFFLLVGLEIKREALIGELASPRKAALPIAAALGGMVLPAAIYFAWNPQGPGAAGWGIPMATDIAFALGVLALLGDLAPPSLKIFLAALAIADDIGAVLVIAFFYTAQISWLSLAVAGIAFVLLIILNRLGGRHPLPYAVLGLILWLAFLKSGVHATIAGILLATTIPCRQRLDGPAFLERSEKSLADFRKAEESGDSAEALGAKSKALHRLTSDCQRAEAPMLRFEHALAPWIRHFVMPAFALANAGVSLGESGAAALFGRISLGVICGLVLGKPVGIAAFTWLSVRTGASSLPDGVNWRHIVGAGFLAGIGFTMSLFVGTLAFDGPSALDATKIGVLTASLISGAIGAAILARR